MGRRQRLFPCNQLPDLERARGHRRDECRTRDARAAVQFPLQHRTDAGGTAARRSTDVFARHAARRRRDVDSVRDAVPDPRGRLVDAVGASILAATGADPGTLHRRRHVRRPFHRADGRRGRRSGRRQRRPFIPSTNASRLRTRNASSTSTPVRCTGCELIPCCAPSRLILHRHCHLYSLCRRAFAPASLVRYLMPRRRAGHSRRSDRHDCGADAGDLAVAGVPQSAASTGRLHRAHAVERRAGFRR